MQVWVNTHATLNTSFIMVIYGDNVTTPDITSELFAQNVFVSNTGVDDGMNNQWQGLSNLNLNLNAGNYWLSLELRDGNNYDGYLPTGEFGALNAVGTYAFSNPSNGGWIEAPSSDFAFTVSGNISAVPVPAAIWLFGSGLIGLIGIMKPKVRV